MKKQIFDSNSIVWFESRFNVNGKISAIAVPFVFNRENKKIKNLMNNKIYSISFYTDDEEIVSDLNAEYDRTSFKRGPRIESLIVALNASSFIRYFLNDGEVNFKGYYSLDKILKLTKIYQKAINKLEKNEMKKKNKHKESLKTREF